MRVECCKLLAAPCISVWGMMIQYVVSFDPRMMNLMSCPKQVLSSPCESVDQAIFVKLFKMACHHACISLPADCEKRPLVG